MLPAFYAVVLRHRSPGDLTPAVIAAAVSLAVSACSARGSASGFTGSRPTLAPAATRSVSLVQPRLIARDSRLLLGHSYTPDYHVLSSDADGRRLVIFHSICTGSADGHCQAIDVFRNEGRPPIWHRQYVGVLAIRPVPGGFAVRAASYASQDPLCCPSLPSVTDIYTWSGSNVHEAGPLPKSPSG